MRSKLTDRVNGSVRALNALAGFAAPEGDTGLAPCPAHCSIWHNLWAGHQEAGPGDTAPRPREAFRELRSDSKPAGYAGLPTNLASYKKGEVSLPERRLAPVPLESLLPGPHREHVVIFEQNCLRPPSEVAEQIAEAGDVQPYFDPVLRSSRRAYTQFLWQMHRAGMIRWSLSRREAVSPFLFLRSRVNSAL